MSKKVTQLKQSSNFFVISEIELYSVMPVGYLLYYSDVCFLPDFFIPPLLGCTPSKHISSIDSALSKTSIRDQG